MWKRCSNELELGVRDMPNAVRSYMLRVRIRIRLGIFYKCRLSAYTHTHIHSTLKILHVVNVPKCMLIETPSQRWLDRCNLTYHIL